MKSLERKAIASQPSTKTNPGAYLVIPKEAMQSNNIGVRHEAHRVKLAVLLLFFTVRRDLNEEPTTLLEVLAHEVVKAGHVLLLRELHVISLEEVVKEKPYVRNVYVHTTTEASFS
jgi:hypothetical protein